MLGGFPANTINIIMGAPGTGKTMLVEQMVFSHATEQTPALYLTTLSEPLEKIIFHGRSYKFFDESKIGQTIFFEDLGYLLRSEDSRALAQIITDLIAERKPSIIVIDSFKALNDLNLTTEEKRLMIFDMASVLSNFNCTTFLVGEYSADTMTELPEFAIADGIVQLTKRQTGQREQRFLSIEKMRSSSFIPGTHAFNITDAGLEVYQRLLTPIVSPSYTQQTERINTGIKNLDIMMDDGLWRGSTTLIAGPTGSGKTIIGLQFIQEGVKTGEKGLYVGMQENPVQLMQIMNKFNWPAEEYLKSGLFELLYRSPVEMQLDSVATEIFRRIRTGDIKRVVIDALGDLKRRSLDAERFADYMYSLKQWFAVQNVTCMMMYELEHMFEFHKISEEEISNLSDNVVLLRYTDQAEMKRTLRVVKTRGSGHDHWERMFTITSQGVQVEEAKEP